jgi:hypothetical protein
MRRTGLHFNGGDHLDTKTEKYWNTKTTEHQRIRTSAHWHSRAAAFIQANTSGGALIEGQFKSDQGPIKTNEINIVIKETGNGLCNGSRQTGRI